ncbi:unnamed protein product [Calypogeia fissa]
MAKIAQCPFCDIANGRTEGRTTAILYQDNRVIAFEDRSPQAFRHYLVIPVAHVMNVKSLTKSKDDYALVVQMQKVGQSLLEKDAPNAHLRFGFHKPPLNTVDHLHLHCLALPYKGWWRSVKYTSLGFLGAWIGVEKVLERLNPEDTNLPV